MMPITIAVIASSPLAARDPLRRRSRQELMRVFEFIGYALVGYVLVLVVIRQDASGVLELLRRLDRMRGKPSLCRETGIVKISEPGPFSFSITNLLQGSVPPCSVALAKPGRNVSFAVQNAPDIDVVIPLDIEHQIGITLDRPASKAWQVQLLRIAR
jgi:hypothetical protein